MTSLFPPRESLVSDIPSWNGNIEKLFLQYIHLNPDTETAALVILSKPYTETMLTILFLCKPFEAELFANVLSDTKENKF